MDTIFILVGFGVLNLVAVVVYIIWLCARGKTDSDASWGDA